MAFQQREESGEIHEGRGEGLGTRTGVTGEGEWLPGPEGRVKWDFGLIKGKTSFILPEIGQRSCLSLPR